jgi:hypothetical protein
MDDIWTLPTAAYIVQVGDIYRVWVHLPLPVEGKHVCLEVSGIGVDLVKAVVNEDLTGMPPWEKAKVDPPMPDPQSA